MPESVRGDSGAGARREMQAGLMRSFSWLVTAAAAVLTVRESVAGGPIINAALATLLGIGALLWSSRPRAPIGYLLLALCSAIVLLTLNAARLLGGAAGPALSFSFLPGFLAILALGPARGWLVCAAMLAGIAWLGATTPLPQRNDLLRFIDVITMTLFASGLAHALFRCFGAYEAAIAKRKATLVALAEQQKEMASTIYEQLDPTCARLVAALSSEEPAHLDVPGLWRIVRSLIENLRQAKALARRDESEPVESQDPDRAIRSGTMRVWLRLGAVLMAFYVLRNIWAGAPFLPSVFSLGFCVLFDVWLGRPVSQKHLEVTALAVGLCATGPMIAHIHAYGATPSAPPLVVIPGIVLFTALLSQGPASWAILALNVAILGWVGAGKTLSLEQSRLLSDLAITCLFVLVALVRVFALRGRYARALLEQGQALAAALRQHRRLAGTLFHDVSNHLQALTFHLELGELSSELPRARSLGRRIQRLITLSKDFLLSPQPANAPTLEAVSVNEAVESLKEAFGPRLEHKQQRLATGTGLELCVRAQPELLIDSVLGNLLSNAIKFSPRGSVIHLSAERVDDRVCIVLSDAGPGLPQDVRRHLGQDGAIPSHVGTAGELGQGYGLQLAEEHLARMSGRLQLKNPAQGGTKAIVWLPVA